MQEKKMVDWTAEECCRYLGIDDTEMSLDELRDEVQERMLAVLQEEEANGGYEREGPQPPLVCRVCGYWNPGSSPQEGYCRHIDRWTPASGWCFMYQPMEKEITDEWDEDLAEMRDCGDK